MPVPPRPPLSPDPDVVPEPLGPTIEPPLGPDIQPGPPVPDILPPGGPDITPVDPSLPEVGPLPTGPEV
jgi:hypothetical protein